MLQRSRIYDECFRSLHKRLFWPHCSAILLLRFDNATMVEHQSQLWGYKKWRRLNHPVIWRLLTPQPVITRESATQCLRDSLRGSRYPVTRCVIWWITHPLNWQPDRLHALHICYSIVNPRKVFPVSILDKPSFRCLWTYHLTTSKLAIFLWRYTLSIRSLGRWGLWSFDYPTSLIFYQITPLTKPFGSLFTFHPPPLSQLLRERPSRWLVLHAVPSRDWGLGPESCYWYSGSCEHDYEWWFLHHEARWSWADQCRISCIALNRTTVALGEGLPMSCSSVQRFWRLGYW